MRSTCFLLFLIAFSGRTWSGEDADKPAIDKQAEDVLRAAAKFYSGLNSFRTTMTFTSKIATNGMNMEIKMAYDLAVQSPNKFILAAKEGILKKNIYSDGKTLTTWDGNQDEYTQEAAPASLSEAFEKRLIHVEAAPMTEMLFLNSLLSENDLQKLLKSAKSASYVGSERLDETKVHHIRVFELALKLDIFIKDGDQPLLLRVIPQIQVPDSADPQVSKQMQSFKMDLSVVFAEWQINAGVPADIFTFKPGPDAIKVDSFFRSYGKFVHESPIGKPMPAMGLKTTDDKPFDFSVHKNKDVVLFCLAGFTLDREKLVSVLGELANEYKDKGVVCYAVAMDWSEMEKLSTRESGIGWEALDKQIKEKQWPITVLRDKKLRFTTEFSVSAVWFIVGKDGTLQAFKKEIKTADPKATLKEALDLILAGKPVPPEPEEDPSTPKKDTPAQQK